MNDNEIRGMFYILLGFLIHINSYIWALFDEILVYNMNTPFEKKMIVLASGYIGIAILTYGIYRLIRARFFK